MDEVLEVLKYVIPSLVVFATAYALIRMFLENKQGNNRQETKIANQKVVTPIRLQAYERLVLLMERITPESLILRVHKSGMSAKLMQAELSKIIRQEFDHNISQQVYVNDKTWSYVKHSKEEMLKLVNLAGTQMNDDSTGLDYSSMFLEMAGKLEKLPNELAIEQIKKEAKLYF